MNMLYIACCVIVITNLVALKIKIRLLCTVASGFFCYTLYQALQTPLHDTLLQNIYITFGYTLTTTGALLLCRRWPLLWGIQSTAFILFGISGFPIEHKMLIFGLYAGIGLLLPTLYALKHHESVFKSASVEMAFITPITICYTTLYLVSEWLRYNTLTFKSITALLNWIYLLPITPYSMICTLTLLIALAPFLCAELLLYIAPEDNNAIRRSLLIATGILVATAFIQPSSMIHLCLISVIANLLIGYYKHATQDSRGSIYLILSIIVTGSLCVQKQSPQAADRLYKKAKQRLLPIIKSTHATTPTKD